MVYLQPFTSESVTEGHPDKVCDIISDTILDAMLEQDPDSHVAVETMVTTGLVHVAGEVTTKSYVEIPHIVREQISNIGYTSSAVGFDGASCGVTTSIGQQSPDIAASVAKSLESREMTDVERYSRQGAGDQGMMFGYATNETKTLMPAPIQLAHRLAEQLAKVRKTGAVPFLRPDGKTQVTIGYDGNKPVQLQTVVISTQHDESAQLDWLAQTLENHVLDTVLESEGLDLDTSEMKVLVNPSGRFVVGGPMGDAGLTGRKIIVDTYGGFARHGGGAFSGKDASKVDRSGAYAARWVAKNVVAAGLASRCEIQVAYAIGRAHPVSLRVDTQGTETQPVDRIRNAVAKVFDLRPAAIIDTLGLKRPIFAKTAAYGHFGRELPEFTWEKTDRVEELLRAL
ncbi:S-adenosylmethionine synthetase [Actinobaculum suis]|uniref:S-adenosylmethionine synthase n=1 Tax=Actinobaculum suis TaxID=1657 RepID=A0A0K9EUY2_9ACTO|nr:methionine adenosyltransferase [Actinobaculum suis]KMY23691.1 S-adenosylmethionine synthetase [Actinobaculum suis]MDY5153132.1 methionine adenosyltransferase [Actinobaculum suis]OCA93778.1 methionine adenosyltransferase [Actinobaculum suis]OCA94071.1 methionine adenosyltransferase [Actinobaculum suis]SDE33379.1 S-adenosylmethionine synthetase [Actinobaculum suis]